MSRTLPLFKIDLITQDLRVRSLSLMAQLFFIKLMALANDAGGFVSLNGKALTLERAAGLLGFPVGAEFSEICAEISGQILLEERGGVWCVPEMVEAFELRCKRQKAGSIGGKSAQKTLKKTLHVVCSSKSKSNVVALEPRGVDAAAEHSRKKEKEPKRKNNKYIYIFQEKVFTGDRGTAENPVFMTFDHFTLYRREYRAVQKVFELCEDRLDAFLAQHDRWLSGKGAAAQAAWLPCLLAFLRKVTASEISATAVA